MGKGSVTTPIDFPCRWRRRIRARCPALPSSERQRGMYALDPSPTGNMQVVPSQMQPVGETQNLSTSA